MEFKYDVSLKPAQEIIERLGLNPGGRAQIHFTSEVMRWSDDYVPMDGGMLKNNTSMLVDGTGYTYESPYAHYHYQGELYVDEKTLKGAFFSPYYGFWSRKGVPKIKDPNGRKLNNWNGKRGPFWVERMWADNGEAICRELENFIRSGRSD